MKILDIGCGKHKTPGAVGLDSNPLTDADVIHDLDRVPYPFPDDEFDLVVYNMSFSHVVDPAWIDRIAHTHRDRGIPAVILHGATHSYRRSTTESWKELMGASSMRHDAQREFRVERIAPDHPIVRDLPPEWGPGSDELYEIERTWPTMTPLLQAWSVESEAHHPVAWTNEHGAARVFVTTLGHNNSTMAAPEYLDMVARGVRWVLGGDD